MYIYTLKLIDMVKRKNLSKSDVITKYMNYTLEHGIPVSVYALAKAQDFDEQQFYQYFGTLQKLESEIFIVFFENTLTALGKSEDYQSFDARNKLLSFYYTFFENLSANRSYVLLSLNSGNLNLKDLKKLSGLRKEFLNFVGGLGIKITDFKQEKIGKFQEKAIEETAWAQLLLTLKFWAVDGSPAFEKTDLLIEKAVAASFDLIDSNVFKSLFDLGKFLVKEKFEVKQ